MKKYIQLGLVAVALVMFGATSVSADCGYGGSCGEHHGPGDQGPDPTVLPTPKPKPVVKPKAGKVLGASTQTLKSAADKIEFKAAPITVENLFKAIFGRSITAQESAFWKNRARTDKTTQSAITAAMTWHKNVGSTGVKLTRTQTIAMLKSSLNSIFTSVYGHAPSASEQKYWTSRIPSKMSVTALQGAMQFHLGKGIQH